MSLLVMPREGERSHYCLWHLYFVGDMKERTNSVSFYYRVISIFISVLYSTTELKKRQMLLLHVVIANFFLWMCDCHVQEKYLGLKCHLMTLCDRCWTIRPVVHHFLYIFFLFLYWHNLGTKNKDKTPKGWWQVRIQINKKKETF